MRKTHYIGILIFLIAMVSCGKKKVSSISDLAAASALSIEGNSRSGVDLDPSNSKGYKIDFTVKDDRGPIPNVYIAFKLFNATEIASKDRGIAL